MVIAILAAMLLPALNMAKERARIIVCISNMKQFGIGSALFSSDNDRGLPDSYSWVAASGGYANHWESPEAFRNGELWPYCFLMGTRG